MEEYTPESVELAIFTGLTRHGSLSTPSSGVRTGVHKLSCFVSDELPMSICEIKPSQDQRLLQNLFLGIMSSVCRAYVEQKYFRYAAEVFSQSGVPYPNPHQKIYLKQTFKHIFNFILNLRQSGLSRFVRNHQKRSLNT